MKAIMKIAMALAVVATISFTSCSNSSSASGEAQTEKTLEDKVVELANKAEEDINAAKTVDDLNQIQDNFAKQLEELTKGASEEELVALSKSQKFYEANDKCIAAFGKKMEELGGSDSYIEDEYMSYADDETISLNFDDYEAAAQETMQAGMDQYNSAVEAAESQINAAQNQVNAAMSEYGF